MGSHTDPFQEVHGLSVARWEMFYMSLVMSLSNGKGMRALKAFGKGRVGLQFNKIKGEPGKICFFFTAFLCSVFGKG